jgi:hypothetical protein
MAITVSDISALVARFGNEIVHEQSNQAAPLRQHFKEHKEGGRVGIVNPKEGEVSSVGWLADSGTLPEKRNVTPVQFTYLPKFLYGKLGIPRGAATLATGEGEGINLVKEELESLGASLGRQLERAILGSTIETLTAATEAELDAAISLGGQSTMTTSNPEAYRVGMIVERRSSGAGALEELMRVAKVEYSPGSATATITFDRSSGITQTNAGNLTQTGYGYASTAGTASATGDVLYPLGGYDDACVSLYDVANGTCYGTDAAVPGWTGNYKDISGSLTRGDMRDMSTTIKRRAGKGWDKIFMNSLNLQRYEEFMLDARRFVTGKMDAVGGVKSEFEGKDIVVSENVASSKIHFVSTDDAKIHCFKDFVDDMDGGPAPASASGLAHAQVDASTFDYFHERWGAFNLRVTKRNAHGLIDGITG